MAKVKEKNNNYIKKEYPFEIKMIYPKNIVSISITDNENDNIIILSVKDFVHIRKAHKTLQNGIIHNISYEFNDEMITMTQGNNKVSLTIKDFVLCLR